MTEVAHGVIKIDVRDDEALASLRHLSNQVERELRDIDKQKASATATLDTSDIDKSVKDAQRKLKQLERRKAKLKVDGDAYKRIAGQIRDAEKEVVSLSKAQQRAHALRERNIKKIEDLETRASDVRAKQREREERIALASSKRIEAAEQKRLNAEMAAMNKRRREAAKSDREAMARMKAREREAAKSRSQEARDAARKERENQRAQAALQREIDALPKLRAEYVKAAAAMQAFDQKRRAAHRTRDPIKIAQVEFNFKAAEARMEHIRQRLQRIGEPPPEIDLHISPGRNLGEQVRKVYKDRGVVAAGKNFGATLGTNALIGFRSRFNRKSFARENVLAMGGNALSAVFTKFGSLASSLSSATVRIGPFTATIRQALVGLAALGPIIVDVVGALGSMVSVVGSGLVGGLGAATAGVGAFGLVLGSTALLLPSLLRDFKHLTSTQDAYHKAVLKFGKGSEQAEKKLKQFNNSVKGATPTARKAFLEYDKLQDSWRNLSKASRPDFINAVGEAITTARHGIKRFGPEVTQSFALVSKGFQAAMKGLRSKEASGIFQTLFDQGQRALPSFGRGLGNLAHAAGNVAAAFSRMLPSLGGGFEKWTQGILKFTNNAEKMKHLVDSTTSSLRNFGHLAQASGRFLTAFFKGGVEAGNSMTVTMTNALNRWTDFLNTDAGQRKLGDFFERAVSGAQALYSVLAPIGSAFVGWATALSPVVATFFKAAGVVGSFVQKILSLTILRGPLTAFAATLGTLWAVTKIGAAAAAIGNFTRALLGLRAAYAAAGAAGAASGIAQLLGGGAAAAGGAGKAAKAAAGASKLGGALAAVGGAATIAGGGMDLFNRKTSNGSNTATKAGKNVGKTGGLLSKFGGLAKTAGGAVAGFGLRFALPTAAAAGLGYAVGGVAGNLLGMNDKVNASKSGLNKVKAGMQGASQAGAALAQVTRGGGAAYRELQRSTLGVLAARQNLKQLEDAGLRNTVQGRTAALDLADAEDNLNTQLTNRAKLSSQVIASLGKRIQGAKELEKAGLFEEKDYAQQERNIKNYNAALENHQGILVNNQRAMKGLGEYSKKGTQEVGKFVRGFKDVPNAKKLVVDAKTEGAGQKVAKLSNDLAKTGKRKTAVNIVANSKNADQALARLRRVKAIQQRVDIVTKGGPQALSIIRKLVGAKLAPKVMRILGSDSSARQKVAALKALGIDPKTLKILGDIAHAQAAARRAEGTRLSPLQQLINRLIGRDESRNPPASVSQIVNRIARKIGPWADGGPAFGPTPAANGMTGASPDRDRINRAAVEAQQREVRDIRKGGRVSRPTILAGEENRTEFVIPTNPRYRERAKALLASAARSIGMRREADGVIGATGMIAAALGTAPSLGVQNFSKSPTFSNRKTAKKWRSLKNKKRKKFKGIPGNPWVGRLNRLDTQQNDLEREAQIRQGSVKEPEDFIVETKDRVTGDTKYSFDKNAYTNWVAEVGEVRKVYEALKNVVTEIHQVIPKAMEFANAQIAGNKRNISILSNEYNALKKKKGGNEATKKKRQARMDKLRQNLDKQKQQLRERREFRGGLGERKKEAQFDWREYDQQVKDIDADIGDRKTDADKQIADNAAQGTQGGAGSDQLSYGQQVAASAAQQQRVLADHGSNLSVTGGGATTGAPSSDAPQKRMLSTGGSLAALGGTLSAAGTSTQAAVTPTGTSGAGSVTTVSAGATAAGVMTSADGLSAPAPTGGDTTVNITNQFSQPPEDPHTWSKGVEYEMGAIL